MLFHIVHLHHIFPSLNSSQILQTPIPTKLNVFFLPPFSLFLKKANNENKTNLTTIIRKKILSPQNSQKIHWVHFVLVNYFWAWSLFLTMIDIPSDTPVEKAGFPTPQQVSFAKSFLVRGRTMYQLSLLSAGILSTLNQCRSCEHY